MGAVDPRDAALQALTPVVMAPRFGQFVPLTRDGHRFVVGADGMWLEVRRKWLYLRTRLTRQTAVAMPFGSVTPTLQYAVAIPPALIWQFVEVAKSRLPNEVAAWIVWCEERGELSLRVLDDNHASPAMVEMKRPVLRDTEHLVVDIHSHGTGGAFFSSTDDADDSVGTRVSVVVGRVDQQQPQMVSRLCVEKLLLPSEYDGIGSFHVTVEVLTQEKANGERHVAHD